MGNFSRTYPMVSFLRAVYSVTTLCFHPATGHTSHLSHTFSLQDDLKLRQKLISSLFSSFSIPLRFSANDVCFLLSQTSLDTLLSLFWSLFSFFALAFGGPTSPLAATAFCNTKITSHGAIPTVLRKWDIFMRKCSIPQARGTACSKDPVRTEHLLTDLGSKHEPGCSQVKTCVLTPMLQVSALTESKSGTFCPTKSVLCFLFTLLLNTHS